MEEPIQIKVTISNIGSTVVYIGEMDVRLGTLDFFIRTPQDGTVHYIGPFVDKVPDTILIEPNGGTYEYKIVINSPGMIFGKDQTSEGVGSQEPIPYHFKSGHYSIIGKYVSNQVIEPSKSSLSSDILVWQGELISEPPLVFAILE